MQTHFGINIEKTKFSKRIEAETKTGKNKTIDNISLYIPVTLVLLIALISIILISGNSSAVNPPSQGDWIINDNTVIENQTVDIIGNITVVNGGSLTLKNVTIIMSCSYNGEFNITIENGGTLIMRDLDNSKGTTWDTTTITSNNTLGTHRYGFRAEKGSSVTMLGSKINNCGWENEYNNRGPTLLCDDWLISESIFSGNFMGLFVNSSNLGTVRHCNISGNGHNGIYLMNSTNITVESCNISGSDGHGVNMFNSHHNEIRYNVMSGFYNDYVWWPANDGCGVWLEESTYNLVEENIIHSPKGARGIWLEASHYNTLSGNWMDGNTFDSTMCGFAMGVFNSTNNTLKYNEMKHYFFGIYVHYYSHYNIIESNFIDYTIRPLSLSDPVYGYWDQFKGVCNYNYFGNNSVNNTDFHGFIIIEGARFNYICNTIFTNGTERTQDGMKFGFLIDHSDNNTVVNSHFDNNTHFSVGIGIQYSSGCIIRDNVIGHDGLDQEAINLYGDCYYNIVENNTVYEREWSISVGGNSHNNVIRNNHVFQCDYGIAVWSGSSNNLVINNSVNDTLTSGLYSFDFGNQKAYDNIFTGNTIWDCPWGIHGTDDCFNLTTQGNLIFDCDQGIRLEGSLGHFLGLDNIFNCTSGIRLISISESEINNSEVHNITDCGINISGSHNITISNSTFHDDLLAIKIDSSYSLHAIGNEFFKNPLNLLTLDMSDIGFKGNRFHHMDVGFRAQHNLSYFQDNSFHHNTYGLEHYWSNVDFTGCIFHNNTYGLVTIGEGCNISCSTFIDNLYGFHSENIGNSNIFDGHFINNNYGVYIDSADGILIEGSTFRSNLGYGVYSTNNANVDIMDGIFYENVLFGIYTEFGGKADLFAENDLHLEKNRILISGNITIEEGGEMTLQTVDLKLYSLPLLTCRITVNYQGILNVLDSVVSPATALPYHLNVLQDGELNIRNSKILGCGSLGVRSVGSGSGIYLQGAQCNIIDSQIGDSKLGLSAVDSTIILENATFMNLEDCIHIQNSQVLFSGCSFIPYTGYNPSLIFENSQTRLENTTILNTGYILDARHSTNITMINTAVDENQLSADATSYIICKFQYEIILFDPFGGFIEGQSYQIRDGKGDLILSGASDNNGSTGDFYTIWLVFNNDNADYDHNPHSVVIPMNPCAQVELFNVDSRGMKHITVYYYPEIITWWDLNITEDIPFPDIVDLNDWFNHSTSLDFSVIPADYLNITVDENGMVSITPLIANWFGEDYVTFLAVDDYGMTSYITVKVTVLPVDDAPVILISDSLIIENDEVLTIHLENMVYDIDTPLHLLNISLMGQYGTFDGYNLTIPYILNHGAVHMNLTVSDNTTTIFLNFTIYYEHKDIYSIIPDIDVTVDFEKVIHLEDYFDILTEDLPSLSISTSSEYAAVNGTQLILHYPYGIRYQTVFVFYELRGTEVKRMFNVTVTGYPLPPEFHQLPDIEVEAGETKIVDLSDYFSISAQDHPLLEIRISGKYTALIGNKLHLDYPEGTGKDIIYVEYILTGYLEGRTLRTFNVTVIDPNHIPYMVDHYVSKEGYNYTFTLLAQDKDGDGIMVFLELDGNITEMTIQDAETGKFQIVAELSPGEHDYHFILHDTVEMNQTIITSSNTITVPSPDSTKPDDDDRTGSDNKSRNNISYILLIILLILVVLLLLFVLYRKGRKEQDEEEVENRKRDIEDEMFADDDGDEEAEVIEGEKEDEESQMKVISTSLIADVEDKEEGDDIDESAEGMIETDHIYGELGTMERELAEENREEEDEVEKEVRIKESFNNDKIEPMNRPPPPPGQMMKDQGQWESGIQSLLMRLEGQGEINLHEGKEQKELNEAMIEQQQEEEDIGEKLRIETEEESLGVTPGNEEGKTADHENIEGESIPQDDGVEEDFEERPENASEITSDDLPTPEILPPPDDLPAPDMIQSEPPVPELEEESMDGSANFEIEKNDVEDKEEEDEKVEDEIDDFDELDSLLDSI